VPFGNYQVADKAFKGRPKTLTSSIHNYYFAKALDLVRPGGIVAFITSHYTMDAQDPACAVPRRRARAARRDPAAQHRVQANAGTEVVTDIIFLQKRETEPPEPSAWVPPTRHPSSPATATINNVLRPHPEMVLGTHALTGSMYATTSTPSSRRATSPSSSEDAIAKLPAACLHARRRRGRRTRRSTSSCRPPAAPADVREGAWFEEGGKLFIKENGVGVPIALARRRPQRVRGLLKVRDALRTTMRAMLDPASTDAQIAPRSGAEQGVRRLRPKHGYLSKPKNYRALREDPDVYTCWRSRSGRRRREAPRRPRSSRSARCGRTRPSSTSTRRRRRCSSR
jgi:hypothetical protein